MKSALIITNIVDLLEYRRKRDNHKQLPEPPYSEELSEAIQQLVQQLRESDPVI